MKLYKIGSRRSFVNMFADFIVNELNSVENDSIVQVTDCGNFIVVGGFSGSQDILDISDLKFKFNEKYQNLFKDFNIDKINIIDLIVYNKNPILPKNVTFGYFYKNDRPIYNSKQSNFSSNNYSYNDYQDKLLIGCDPSKSTFYNENIITENLHISSEMPHGFSLGCLRNKLYYSEYVSYNLFSIVGISKIKLNWIDDVVNLDCDSFINLDYIDSLMKDVFDFDLEEFNKKIKEYNFIDDILDPFSDKPWLVKDKVSELFII